MESRLSRLRKIVSWCSTITPRNCRLILCELLPEAPLPYVIHIESHDIT